MAASQEIEIRLNAVIVAVTKEEPRLLVVDDTTTGKHALPFGPFNPVKDRTLEQGLRGWVKNQTSLQLGHVEQLYTFGDRGRDTYHQSGRERVVSVGYLALTNEANPGATTNAHWTNWYDYLPWEDWRDGEPKILQSEIRPRLSDWFHGLPKSAATNSLRQRIHLTFGLKARPWNEELVLERYELLYEAGLVAEAVRSAQDDGKESRLGLDMHSDHRRIIATALGRLRGKIKYRPLVFELMPERFTLFQLQRAVEALSGVRLHKQNFRRLIADGGLVEETGSVDVHTGGRPAKQFSFREDVLLERLSPGVKIPGKRRTR